MVEQVVAETNVLPVALVGLARGGLAHIPNMTEVDTSDSFA